MTEPSPAAGQFVLPSRIFLTGYMGAGKSTVGKLLAQELSYRFHDTDYLVMRGYRKPIARVFQENGEASFRRAELLVLKELATRSGIVISTGGGTLARADAFQIAQAAGIVIYLSAPVSDLYERVIFSPKKRPIVDVPESESVFKERFLARQAFYEQADCTVHTLNRRPEDVMDDILNYLKERTL
jgi:shikimate kinase